MLNPTPTELSARELADLAGTTVRTIHYYTAEGLLPPGSGTTRNATYSSAHLARLRLIAALREEGLSLAAIRSRIAPLTNEQVLAVVNEIDRQLSDGPPSTVSTLGLIEAALATQAATDEKTLAEVQSPAERSTGHSRLLREDAWDQQSVPAVFASATPEPPAPGSARDYLDRLRHRPPAQPEPLPRPGPPRPQRKPEPPRPEAWYHFRIDDGVELRVREDRYHQAKGRLAAVTDALRAVLDRYGMARDASDGEEHESRRW
jgi:DNA-binding transcriptional MerR regulator